MTGLESRKTTVWDCDCSQERYLEACIEQDADMKTLKTSQICYVN